MANDHRIENLINVLGKLAKEHDLTFDSDKKEGYLNNDFIITGILIDADGVMITYRNYKDARFYKSYKSIFEKEHLFEDKNC